MPLIEATPITLHLVVSSVCHVWHLPCTLVDARFQKAANKPSESLEVHVVVDMQVMLEKSSCKRWGYLQLGFCCMTF